MTAARAAEASAGAAPRSGECRASITDRLERTRNEVVFASVLFEVAVIGELFKESFARGRRPKLYCWRDANGRESGLVVERGTQPHAIVEIKSSATYAPKFFKVVDRVGELMGIPRERRFVVYGGDESFETSHGTVPTLRDAACVLS